MALIQIDENKEFLKIVFEEKRPGRFIQIVLLSLVFLIGLFPIFILFKVKFSAKLVLGIIVIFFIAYYFLRLFLWNKYGKEIIEVNPKELKQTFDYKWFEEEVNVFKNENVEIRIIEEENGNVENSVENILDLEVIKTGSTAINIVLAKNDKEFFVIKTETSIQEAKELIEKISQKLN